MLLVMVPLCNVVAPSGDDGFGHSIVNLFWESRNFAELHLWSVGISPALAKIENSYSHQGTALPLHHPPRHSPATASTCAASQPPFATTSR